MHHVCPHCSNEMEIDEHGAATCASDAAPAPERGDGTVMQGPGQTLYPYVPPDRETPPHPHLSQYLRKAMNGETPEV